MFLTPSDSYRTSRGASLCKSERGDQNRHKPILPSLVLCAFFVAESKRRAQRSLPSRKRPIETRRTTCVALAKTMRRGGWHLSQRNA